MNETVLRNILVAQLHEKNGGKVTHLRKNLLKNCFKFVEDSGGLDAEAISKRIAAGNGMERAFQSN